jgi:hypothetical protein
VTVEPPRRRRAPRAHVRRRRALLGAVAALVLFLLGVALGQVIEQNGGGSGDVTYERTVNVRPVPETVTVTVTETSP